MNVAHDVICSSRWWARGVEQRLLPWALDGAELGADVLELGPGFGATTRELARRVGRLSVIEPQRGYCERLRSELGDRVTVVQGDATQMPFGDAVFSGVVCFTMLHHVPSPQLQDCLLREAARVLRPGGTLAGTDSLAAGLLFKAIHIGDDLEPVDPAALAGRLLAAGFVDPRVDTDERSLRFRARKPA
jgi:ubiquinone/menaquinone biosynthesis C-methylase UbiE